MSTAVATISSAFYLLTLIGGVNWLVTGVRLSFPPEHGSGEANLTLIPDALSWGGESFQLAIYYIVGASSLALFVLSISGWWIRKGEPLISCERIPV